MNKTFLKQVIIGVITCPNHENNASAIRATWLRGVPPEIRVFFVYGRPGSPASIEGDCIYLDCPEAYEHLPEKMHRFFEFCSNRLDFDFLLKIDDDSYVDIGTFLDFDTRGGDYIGLIRGMGDPRITRTWHYGKCTDKSYEIPYDGEYVCDWARGGGYLLSRKALNVLVEKTASMFSEHLFEDKMVGEALTLDDRIKKVHVNYVDMGILNPMPPHNMRFVYELLEARK